MQDERLRAAVGEDMRDLIAAPVPVDRDRARAERDGRDRGFDELDRVAQQKRDPLAGADAGLCEARAESQRARKQLGVAARALAAADADLLHAGHQAQMLFPARYCALA